MNKYKIGDLVRIREDADKIQGRCGFVYAMERYLGEEHRVLEVRSINNHDTYVYKLEDCTSAFGILWSFDEKWLTEPAEDIEIDEKDIMKMFV